MILECAPFLVSSTYSSLGRVTPSIGHLVGYASGDGRCNSDTYPVVAPTVLIVWQQSDVRCFLKPSDQLTLVRTPTLATKQNPRSDAKWTDPGGQLLRHSTMPVVPPSRLAPWSIWPRQGSIGAIQQ